MRIKATSLAASAMLSSTALCCSDYSIPFVSAGFYDYRQGGDDWQEQYPDSVCGTGRKQSPIDLSFLEGVSSDADIAIQLNGFGRAFKEPLEQGKRMETNWDVDFGDTTWAKTAELLRRDSEGEVA